jgi:hypothetical protein
MIADFTCIPTLIKGALHFVSPTKLERKLFYTRNISVPVSGEIPLPEDSFVLAYDPNQHTCNWRPAHSLTKHSGVGIVVNTKRKGQVITTNDECGPIHVPCGTQHSIKCLPPENEHGALVPAIRAQKHLTPPCEIAELETGEFKTAGVIYPLAPRVPLNRTSGYVLGLICGDGWAVQGKGTFYGVAVAKVRDDVMDQFDDCLTTFFSKEAPHRRPTETKNGNHGYSIKNSYNCVELGKLVHSHCGHGARNKHLPDFFMCAPLDFRLGLFAGLMDSDGSLSISTGKKKPQLMASFTSISSRMIEEVRWLAMSLGIPGTITLTRTPRGDDSYILNFSTIAIQKWNGQFMADGTRLGNLHSAGPISQESTDIIPISSSLAKAFRKAVGCPKITKAMKEDPGIDRSHIKRAKSIHATLSQAANPKHAKYGAISRESAEKMLSHPKVQDIKHPDLEVFARFANNEDITWQRVSESYELGDEDYYYTVNGPNIDYVVTMNGLIADVRG